MLKNKKQRLLLEQVDRKLNAFKPAEDVIMPPKGWLNAVRVSLNMTLQQLGRKLQITPQSARDLELRESAGTISIARLREAAQAMDMKLVYGLIPKGGSLEQMIEKRAAEIAREIVLRTSNSMKLEDQENSTERIDKAIRDKTTEITAEIPKYLWE